MDIDLTGLVLPERAESVASAKAGRSETFLIEPLERGFGTHARQLCTSRACSAPPDRSQRRQCDPT